MPILVEWRVQAVGVIEVRAKIRELKALERSLVGFVKSGCVRAGGPGPECVILDDLAGPSLPNVPDTPRELAIMIQNLVTLPLQPSRNPRLLYVLAVASPWFIAGDRSARYRQPHRVRGCTHRASMRLCADDPTQRTVASTSPRLSSGCGSSKVSSRPGPTSLARSSVGLAIAPDRPVGIQHHPRLAKRSLFRDSRQQRCSKLCSDRVGKRRIGRRQDRIAIGRFSAGNREIRRDS